MIDAKTDSHVEPERLSAWIDDDLPAAEAEEVARHLQGCAACRGIVEDLRAITAAARELDPPEAGDGWGAIARRVERPHRRRFRLLAVAAALALGLGALLFTRFASPPPQRGSDPVVHRAHVELGRLHRQQQRTIDALMTLAKRDRRSWDPTLRRTFTNNLGLVDAAIAECRRALERRPDDVALKASLMAAYQRKVDLLELFTQSGEDR
jgi:hypothetical protein